MFFLWDVIFGTAKITRRYPEQYGVENYMEEEWYAQVLYPVFKSAKAGSELGKAPATLTDTEQQSLLEASKIASSI